MRMSEYNAKIAREKGIAAAEKKAEKKVEIKPDEEVKDAKPIESEPKNTINELLEEKEKKEPKKKSDAEKLGINKADE